MKFERGQFWFFASDLMKFQGCMHATTLDLRKLEVGDIVPAEDSEEAALLQGFGHAHEAAFVEQLVADGRQVTQIETKRASMSDAITATRQAMANGDDIITQATFQTGVWGGYADFLYRVDQPSKLGTHSYEVADTKLSRTAKPYQVLQLCHYSDLVADIQGVMPKAAHLELGDGATYTVQLTDVSAYARQMKSRFEDFIAARPVTRPEPSASCQLCRWKDHCAAEWVETDSLVQIAGIAKSQRAKIEAGGIETMQALAVHEASIPKLSATAQDKLVTHARLQTARKAGGPPSFQLRLDEPGRGFYLLPRPDEGDLFYDIEGDPYFEGGLEYLHGVWFFEQGQWQFRDFWAHDRQQEGAAIAKLLDFFAARLRKYPKAHIYHYAAYEITALRRLTAMHRTHEAVFDQLLREQRFVDLYSVVSGALLASEGGYSIKDLEAFYMDKRDGEIVGGGASVVAYEKWRTSGDQAILQMIRDYNEVDCISTQKLRDWLVDAVRPKGLPWPDLDAEKRALGPGKIEEASEALEALRASIAPAVAELGEETAELIVDLNFFHEREDKPAWWAVFDRLSRDRDELFDDLECLAGLVASEAARGGARGTYRRKYRFTPQETKLRTGKTACIKPSDGPRQVTIERLDMLRGVADVKFTRSAGLPLDEMDLIPPMPIGNKILRAAIASVTDALIAGAPSARAVRQFLKREPPRFQTPGRKACIVGDVADRPAAISEAIADMDETVLAIQGPPGTGKTYVSALSIVDLVRAGKRVAVSSNSHKAIENLLIAIARRAQSEGVTCAIAQKVGELDDEPPHPGIEQVKDNENPAIEFANVVGGTAWHLARYEAPAFDHLFVDEAGQVSIANIVAMSGVAANIVLVGDPMQLPQPIQGSHPGQSGQSSLEYFLAGHRVVPDDRGIFLPVSRRMHGGVCEFISTAVYDGKLRNDAGAQLQTLTDPNGGSRTGAHLVEVEHEGCSQSSPEEVTAIAATIKELLGSTYRDRDGKTRKIGLKDFLVVAPYNAQVNELTLGLPKGVRVGTVDKFQGQEAPICLVSMTTSSAEELPRDINFLFSLNRINVAVSRAQVLALVFASPRLLNVPCRTIEQMKLVNTLCALREHGLAPADLEPVQ
jgi:predicted RecB family nuclease|tara:strand:+ start:11673 stop:15026 length:3354 start_codon:yes stop_codon:yes gene_type:complete